MRRVSIISACHKTHTLSFGCIHSTTFSGFCKRTASIILQRPVITWAQVVGIVFVLLGKCMLDGKQGVSGQGNEPQVQSPWCQERNKAIISISTQPRKWVTTITCIIGKDVGITPSETIHIASTAGKIMLSFDTFSSRPHLSGDMMVIFIDVSSLFRIGPIFFRFYLAFLVGFVT